MITTKKEAWYDAKGSPWSTEEQAHASNISDAISGVHSISDYSYDEDGNYTSYINTDKFIIYLHENMQEIQYIIKHTEARYTALIATRGMH